MSHTPLNQLKSQLIRQIGGTFLLKVIAMCLQLVTGILLARQLGPHGYGVYAFPMGVVTLLSVPATAGLPQLIVRNTARYAANGDFKLLKGLLIRSSQFVFLISLALSAGAAVVYTITTETALGSEEGTVFFLSLSLLPLLALKHVRMAALRGLGRVLLGQLPDLLVRPAVFLFFLASTLFLFDSNLNARIAIQFQVGAVVLAFVVGFAVLYFYAPSVRMGTAAEFRTSEWMRSSFPFLALGVMLVINQQLDIVMLGILRPPSDVGVYKTVVQGSTLVSFLLAAVKTAQAPHISRLWATAQKSRLQRMITKTARIAALGTIVAAGILMLAGKYFITILFGTEYLIGLLALRILCFGQIINGLSGSVGSILNMTGHESKAATAVAVAAVANVVLNSALIPILGIDGAAIATATSLVTWNGLSIVLTRRYTGIKPTALGFL